MFQILRDVWRPVLVITVICFMCSCGICGLGIAWWDNWVALSPELCTTDDQDYQLFAANIEQWVSDFSSTRDGFASQSFTAKNGSSYWVLIDNWNGHSVFWFQTEDAIRFAYGKAGYLYTTSGTPPTFYDPEDEVTHMSGNIYCYIFADPG